MSPFHISPVTLADLEAMITIAIAAMEYEIVIRFMFGHQHDKSLQLQREFWASIFTKSFHSKDAHIMKATMVSTGETVAFGIVRWADGNWEKPALAPLNTRPEPGVSFIDFYSEEENRNYRRLMAGRGHYVWGILYVLPEHQRKGIGSEILRWGFNTYSLQNEPVFVQTFMGAGGIYAKFAWEEVDAMEINLAEWAGDGRGFGLYRSPQMIRQPKPFD